MYASPCLVNIGQPQLPIQHRVPAAAVQVYAAVQHGQGVPQQPGRRQQRKSTNPGTVRHRQAKEAGYIPAVQQLKGYNSKKLVSSTKYPWSPCLALGGPPEGLTSEETEDQKKEKEKIESKFEPLCRLMKDILGDKVGKVVVGYSLGKLPSQLVIGGQRSSRLIKRSLKEQASIKNNMNATRITLEINPTDPIMEELLTRAEADKSDETLKDLVNLMFETALLSFNFLLDHPRIFSSRVYRMIEFALSVDGNDDVNGEQPPLEEKA